MRALSQNVAHRNTSARVFISSCEDSLQIVSRWLLCGNLFFAFLPALSAVAAHHISGQGHLCFLQLPLRSRARLVNGRADECSHGQLRDKCDLLCREASRVAPRPTNSRWAPVTLTPAQQDSLPFLEVLFQIVQSRLALIRNASRPS
jgi:hypothetical protein